MADVIELCVYCCIMLQLFFERCCSSFSFCSPDGSHTPLRLVLRGNTAGKVTQDPSSFHHSVLESVGNIAVTWRRESALLPVGSPAVLPFFRSSPKMDQTERCTVTPPTPLFCGIRRDLRPAKAVAVFVLTVGGAKGKTMRNLQLGLELWTVARASETARSAEKSPSFAVRTPKIIAGCVEELTHVREQAWTFFPPGARTTRTDARGKRFHSGAPIAATTFVACVGEVTERGLQHRHVIPK